MLEAIIHLRMRLSPLLLLLGLELAAGIQRVDLGRRGGEIHFFSTAEVGRDVGVKTGGYVGARGVGTCEEGVGAAWTVEAAPVGDVVDGAVYG